MDRGLIAFLIRAKRATYAGKGAESAPSRPQFHDLRYAEGDLLYIDTYLGGRKFAGEEALWIGQRPVWSMNYAGRVLGENFSGDFLKAALLRVPEDMPFRGPMLLAGGLYVYRCFPEGTFEWFQGMETIEYKEQLIYECFFHGGLIE